MNASIRHKMRRTKAIVINDDGVLWNGRIIDGIEKSFISNHLGKILPATLNYAKIIGLRRESEGEFNPISMISKLFKSDYYDVLASLGKGANAHVEELKLFYDYLVSNNLGSKSEIRNYSNEFISRNNIRSIKNLLREESKGYSHLPIFLATMNGSTVAHTVRNFFDFTIKRWPPELENYVSNIDRYADEGKLIGLRVIISNGEEKLRAVAGMLRNMDLNIGESTVIGSSEEDIPLLREAKLKIVMPNAAIEVKSVSSSEILSEHAINLY